MSVVTRFHYSSRVIGTKDALTVILEKKNNLQIVRSSETKKKKTKSNLTTAMGCDRVANLALHFGYQSHLIVYAILFFRSVSKTQCICKQLWMN